MASWDDILTPRDKEVFALSGFGKKAGLGQRPALLIIDVNYNFTGDKPEPILESVKRFRTSCGEEGWDGGPCHSRITRRSAQEARTDVLHYAEENRANSTVLVGGWAAKSNRTTEDMTEQWEKANQIVEEIAPQPGDIVVHKQKPSAFFRHTAHEYAHGSPCRQSTGLRYDNQRCVRASVIDAFSYNLKVSVVEDCVFDRGQASHKINLFDMAMKYADVIPLKEAIDYIRVLPDNLYAPRCSRSRLRALG
jgi:isochorismate hydrolase